MKLKKGFKRVYLVDKSDLDALISFATDTKELLNLGRVDKAKEGLDKFIEIVNRTKEDKNV